MMVHPAPVETLRPLVNAVSHFDVTYEGRPAHASAAPERGINAADAQTIAQTSIGLLRQHLDPGVQVQRFSFLKVAMPRTLCPRRPVRDGWSERLTLKS